MSSLPAHCDDQPTASRLSRRSFFSHVGAGVQGAALMHLLGRDLYGATSAEQAGAQAVDLLPRAPHFRRARNRSFICS